MPLARAVTMSLALITMAPHMTYAQQLADLLGDPERGKKVYRTKGECMNCHGWPADGKTGVNLRSPTGANLRETEMDEETLIEVVKCGLPGTQMPYHDRSAYSDGRCFGLAMSDFDTDTKPIRGKTMSDEDIVNVVAYLQMHVIGLGKPTFEECAEFFDNPGVRACKILQ